MGFRARQILALTLVAAAIVLTTTVLNAALLARARMDAVSSTARFQAQALFHQVARIVRAAGAAGELPPSLARDPALRAYGESVVGYSKATLYVAVIDRAGRAVYHSNARLEGQLTDPVESLQSFTGRSALGLLWALQRDRTLAVDMPFGIDDEQPLGAARVAVSTLLIKADLLHDVATNAAFAAAVMLFAFVVSFYVTNVLLAPVERLRAELARIDPGADQPPLDFRTPQDVGRLAEFFASVTSRLKHERPRLGQDDWLAALLGEVTDAVLVVGSDGRVLSLNAGAARLLGQPRAQLEGQRLAEVLPAGHPIAGLVAEALDNPSVVERRIHVTVEGREVLHRLAVRPLHEAGQAAGILVTVRDLEQLSRLAAHLSYSQKLTALGQLTSGVAHEVKSPLHAIVMQSALLRRHVAADDPEVKRYLNTLDEEIRRLDRVIQGFLQFSRPEELHLKRLALDELVETTSADFGARAASAGVRIETELARDLPPVSGDADLLRQALINVFTNAVEAMPSGGTLRVRLDRIPQSLQLTIEDTGVGIPAKDLPKVFRLFHTTKAQGSGIGLSVVYRIAQLHGGDVSIESPPEGGTRVVFTLPEGGE